MNSCAPSPALHALPSCKPMSCEESTWQEVLTSTSTKFSAAIDNAYLQIVHWRKNLFKEPSGASGKCFVVELARLLRLLPWILHLKLFLLRLFRLL